MDDDYKINLFKKQEMAWDALTDYTNGIKNIGYGGAAGGGKSKLGCLWIITMCNQYKDLRYLIGRETLTSLKDSTLNTFLDELNKLKFIEGIHYKFNQQDMIITFFHSNSSVYFRNLQYKPSDKNQSKIGSTEFTGAFVDESNGVNEKILNTLPFRLRLNNLLVEDINGNKVQLIPKMLETFNPDINHVYTRFYHPKKIGKEKKGFKFIQALPSDNPYLSQDVLDTYKNNPDPLMVKRYYYGIFEYDEDDMTIVNRSDIEGFYDGKTADKDKTRYIVADIALEGVDSFVISIWEGLNILKFYQYDKSTPDFIIEKLKELMVEWNVEEKNLVYDAIGVGDYISGFIKEAYSFKSSNKEIKTLQDEGEIKSNKNKKGNREYINLRSQCGYKLGDVKDKIKILDENFKERIIREFSVLKKELNGDRGLKIMSKDKQKEIIGYSPDFLDNFIMRMVFEFIREKVYFKEKDKVEDYVSKFS